jgi:predicted amidophosphoribosyltransferase
LKIDLGETILEEEKEELNKESREQNLEQCSNCGRELPGNTRFCRDCGAAQTKDAFPLLIIGCAVTVLAVFFAWRFAQPYSLVINIAVPIATLVVFAIILSLLLWR